MAKEIDILAVVLGGITEEKLKEYYKLDSDSPNSKQSPAQSID